MTVRRRPKHGQALVEFAILLPVLLVILLGIVDVGRMVYAYNAVSNAAREAGRTAIVNQTPDTIRAQAAEQAVSLGLPTTAPTGCPVAGGPTTTAGEAGTCVVFRSADDTDACPTPTVIGCTAIVAVSWEFRSLIPGVSGLIGGIQLQSTTKQAIEHVCDSLPSCPIR